MPWPRSEEEPLSAECLFHDAPKHAHRRERGSRTCGRTQHWPVPWNPRGHPAHRPAACLPGGSWVWSTETQGSHHPEHLASGTVGLFPEAPPGTVLMAPEGSGQACPASCVRRRAEVAGWEGGSASPGSSSAVLSGAWRGLSAAAPVSDGTSPSCRHPSRSPNRVASHSLHTVPSPEDPP